MERIIPGQITLWELNKGEHLTTEEQDRNLALLLEAINKVRSAYGKPMIVTSGLRSREEHERIYRKLGVEPKWGSCHLKGAAVDIWDRDRSLRNWCMTNKDKLKEWGLYIEHPNATPTWVHFQILPPKSGRTVFWP